MKGTGKRTFLASSSQSCRAIAIVGCLLLGGVAIGQDVSTGGSISASQLPTAPGALLKAQFALAHAAKASDPQRATASPPPAAGATYSEPLTTSKGTRVITLQEAQQKVAPADNNPLVRLGQLQVEVARQTRLGTQSSFFPQIRRFVD